MKRALIIALALFTSAPARADDGHADKLVLDQLSLSDWEHVLSAPSSRGPTGLEHVITAQAALPHSIRAGVIFDGFSASPFLFTPPRDKDYRLSHALSIIGGGLNVPFLRNSELYLTLGGVYNNNQRTDPGRTDPVDISSVGNILFGLKSGWALASGFSLGGRLGVRFWDAPDDVRFKPDAFAGVADALMSWDFAKWRGIPLRLHLNAGGQIDNSYTYLSSFTCAASTSLDACFRSRITEAFAQELSQSQLRLAFGVEVPFRFAAPGGSFGMSLIGEYTGAVVIGGGDTVLDRVLTGTSAGADNLGNRMSHLATAAVRLRPGARFVIDLGADLGIASPSVRFGSKLPPWQGRLGISYSYDFDGVRYAAPLPHAESLPAMEPLPESLPVAAAAQPESEPTAVPASVPASEPAVAQACEPAPKCEPAPVCEAPPKCEPAPVCPPAPKCEPAPSNERLAKRERTPRSEPTQPSEPPAPNFAPRSASNKPKHRSHIIHEGSVLLGLDDPIYFIGAKTLVPPESLRVLADAALYVKTASNIMVSVSVLNDSDGQPRNGKLARERVQTVIKYLVSQGVPPEKIHTRGFGEKMPEVAPASNPANPAIELRIFVSIATAP